MDFKMYDCLTLQQQGELTDRKFAWHLARKRETFVTYARKTVGIPEQ